jgi:tripartite-type tricarboxylate transporter receptor subunit TctC
MRKSRYFNFPGVLIAFTLLLAIPATFSWAAADAYPAKPVRMIIPFAPGGATDIVGRITAAKVGEGLGKQIVAENRSGGGGTIGMEVVAKSAPDGYTLLFHSTGFATASSLYKLGYDPMKAFVPVALVGISPVVLAVHPSLPVQSAKDLIALAKQQPRKLANANAGVGSFTHLSSELFQMMGGIDFLSLQFKGGAPAMTDVIGGHSQVVFGSITMTLPHVKANRLKALGYGWTSRSKLMPDVPTIAEAGLPGYQSAIWLGVFAPAGTPPAIVDRLSKEVFAITKMDDVLKTFDTQGTEAMPLRSADFVKFLEGEIAKWEKVIKARNIKVEG